ncbi:CGA synthase-related protein [Streptomyces sp. RS10V-4]|uniref:CGA synthase-related protein n=1 Tax=Streptomyces rhizoryzae TaxID=2932493 RepID=UPI00200525EA|nr:CGA synthase-related protein [Streptomyces rhizoryzae]MCK7623763.1 CGA synthase-related protein [Streptomyces rhizoryzae]
MAVLRTGGAADSGTGPLRHRVLLVSRDAELDSVLARRRIAAHLGELRPVAARFAPDGRPVPDGGGTAQTALVCDDDATAGHLLDRGVPVVHLRSGHRAGGVGGAAESPPRGALCRVHRPGWLPGPWPPSGGARTTGVLAPARPARDRMRTGTLLLLSLWDVPGERVEGYAAEVLRPLVRAAVRRTGSCTVVCDTRTAAVRDALGGLPRVRTGRAADPAVDADALHARAACFLASPTLGALALAQARRAPLTFLPPLGAAQRDLAERVARAVPVPVAADPDDPAPWAPPGDPAGGPWHRLDPAADDLRGAQRVARTLRQLCLAPL